MACSISGYITTAWNDSIAETLTQIIVNAEDRGRDSFGIIGVEPSYEVFKTVGAPSSYTKEIRNFLKKTHPTLVINNNRAEPTTEFVHKKTWEDIQPFTSSHKSIIVSHNGTIANDKQLATKYGLTPHTHIDSAVLPLLLEYYMTQGKTLLEAIKTLVKEVVGSYALAIADANNPHVLYLVTNYKPLAMYHRETTSYNAIYFSSFPEYLTEEPFVGVEEIKPYTITEITLNRNNNINVYTYSFAPLPHKTALVVVSGGLDSVTVAYYLRSQKYDITLLHFNYQQQATSAELLAVKSLARDLSCPLITLDSSIFQFMPSTLTTQGTINKTRTGMDGAEFAHEWVPARNLIFLSIAVGIAESRGISFIALGNNLEESGAYPDNEMIFIRKLNEVLPFATQVNKSVQILQPLGNLMKHEIVKLGLQLGIPYEKTWSCYEPGVEKHGKLQPCNACGPCYMRRVAFEINNTKDPLLQSGFDIHE